MTHSLSSQKNSSLHCWIIIGSLFNTVIALDPRFDGLPCQKRKVCWQFFYFVVRCFDAPDELVRRFHTLDFRFGKFAQIVSGNVEDLLYLIRRFRYWPDRTTMFMSLFCVKIEEQMLLTSDVTRSTVSFLKVRLNWKLQSCFRMKYPQHFTTTGVHTLAGMRLML